VQLENVTGACQKCTRFVQRVRDARAAEVTAHAAQEDDVDEETAAGPAAGSSDGERLGHRSTDEIWRQRNRDLQGLLEEGLALVSSDG